MLWVNQPRRLAAHPKNGGSDKTDVDREIEKCGDDEIIPPT